MKEPTRSVKAVLLPSWMAPKALHRIAGLSLAYPLVQRVKLTYRTEPWLELGN